MLEFLNDYMGTIIITATIAVSAYIFNFFRKRGSKIESIQDEQDKLKVEIRLIKKTLIIITKIIDKQTEKAHGEDPELSDLAKDLLTANKSAI